jgi:hypothetical protein
MNARTMATIITVLLATAAGPAFPRQADEKMFREVKLLIFDEKWDEAQSRLDDFLAKFPASAYAGQAFYYKGKCLKERGGQERAALEAYREYLQRDDRNRSLAEDAQTSIVDLALKLYAKGDRTFLPDVAEFLDSPSKNVRHYAAIQLSYVKEKKVAEKSVPVLKKIIAEETDSELRDRARIALARVAPEALEDLGEGPTPGRAKMFRLQIIDDRTGKTLLNLNIPVALADLALSAVPENERAMLKTKDFDIDELKRMLRSEKGTILEINDPDEGKTIRISIK